MIMRNLRLLQGKRPGLSTPERIIAMLRQLDHCNKTTCLELIMQLDITKQIIFLNSYLNALEALPDEMTAVSFAEQAQTN